MFAELIGRPVLVEGQEVLLLPDMIGTVPVTEQHEYVEIAKSTNTCAAIQMREADIETVRSVHPRLPVYGLWQTLLASGAVDSNHRLQVVPITENDGYYVHADVGRILYSGNYDAGFFAADAGFRLSTALRIQLSLSDLILPRTPALLAREILASRRRVFRNTFTKMAAFVGLLCFLALGVDFGLQIVSEQEFATIVKKDKKLQVLRQKLTRLSKDRLIETPDQREVLDRLTLVLHDLENVQIQETLNFKSPSVRMSVSALDDPALLFPYVTSKIQPDGRWDILVKLRG